MFLPFLVLFFKDCFLFLLIFYLFQSIPLFLLFFLNLLMELKYPWIVFISQRDESFDSYFLLFEKFFFHFSILFFHVSFLISILSLINIIFILMTKSSPRIKIKPEFIEPLNLFNFSFIISKIWNIGFLFTPILIYLKIILKNLIEVFFLGIKTFRSFIVKFQS